MGVNAFDGESIAGASRRRPIHSLRIAQGDSPTPVDNRHQLTCAGKKVDSTPLAYQGFTEAFRQRQPSQEFSVYHG